MSKLFYPKLALANLKKNLPHYLPYIVSCSFTILAYFIMRAIVDNPEVQNLRGGDIVVSFMQIGSVVAAIFAAIFLYYTNSFLIRRRKKEFALYGILGLEKKHIGLIMFWERLFSSLISLVIGICGGVILGRLLYTLLLYLIGSAPSFHWRIEPQSLIGTLILFAVIFAVIFLSDLFHVQTANPIDLLRAKNTGEREPKASPLLVIFGLLALGGGYLLALTVKDTVSAVLLFFLAVLLVIIGTYCLFTAGSIALLKGLKKRENFYYQARNFISVSGMLYRMKQNAAGLATICILSTMVLVTVGTTVSMYTGCDKRLEATYPYDLYVVGRTDDAGQIAQIDEIIRSSAAASEVQLTDAFAYSAYQATFSEKDGELLPFNGMDWGSSYQGYILDAGQYEALTGQSLALAGDEVCVFSSQGEIPAGYTIGGKPYRLKQRLTESFPLRRYNEMAKNTLALVFADADSAKSAANLLNGYDADGEGEIAATPDYYFISNLASTTLDKEGLAAWTTQTESTLNDLEAFPHVLFSSIYAEEAGWYALNGSFLFLGVFLGFLFLVATVLIIYYKQISEGHDDQERFLIMQKVGMDQSEVRRTIRKQILLVFFLPLVCALIHLAVALKMILQILLAFGLTNTGVILACFAAVALLFALLYIVVYLMTSRTYYKLVRQ